MSRCGAEDTQSATMPFCHKHQSNQLGCGSSGILAFDPLKGRQTNPTQATNQPAAKHRALSLSLSLDRRPKATTRQQIGCLACCCFSPIGGRWVDALDGSISLGLCI
mmetsp:Transcript_26898/g.59282  ORF Transcript_26898/g.59282 Transcript_26898/m.59282 type:complete len:107 (-) Transcript_26898:509-829(-)